MAKLLRHEIERNLHNWWAVYDQKMQHYKSNRDELMCTNHAQLVAWLQEIKPQIEKANFAMFYVICQNLKSPPDGMDPSLFHGHQL